MLYEDKVGNLLTAEEVNKMSEEEIEERDIMPFASRGYTKLEGW
jgi:hypothetical protein